MDGKSVYWCGQGCEWWTLSNGACLLVGVLQEKNTQWCRVVSRLLGRKVDAIYQTQRNGWTFILLPFHILLGKI
jgi:hypothetical protein